MNVPAAAAPDRITLYPQRHARRQRGKALSHIVPALVLLTTAMGAMTGRELLTWVTILEFVVGAAYLGLMVRELLQLRRHAHHHERVAWLELAAAGILALEGYHIMHRHHEADLARGTHSFHVLPYLYFAVAGFFVVMAFTMHRAIERRHLHLHPAGFGGRTGLLQPAFRFDWAEIETVEPVGAADVLVRCLDGRQQPISFASLHDGPAHRDRLVAHARQLHRPSSQQQQGREA
ncbi:hypothetical protein [Hymenobacter chitinivorans]|uniref:Uncharacterized protein n=1 Tax=Hymenobacter chitinivorans DSM 11115 TaxID=1121954 RepID=A0A2M9BTI4_9BACT|nr:hypothetical protein [Hymenobacter chitinivorans]PJJ61255.1 hypothetical protein CLV45_2693 [Hymenobacter chitinivorans DSM 11115]